MPVERIMVMIVIGRGDFALGIAEHQGFHDAAQRVFRERHMRRDESGKPREHQGLHGDALIPAHLIGRAVGIYGSSKKLTEQQGAQPIDSTSSASSTSTSSSSSDTTTSDWYAWYYYSGGGSEQDPYSTGYQPA